ncbi:MAG TPA: hypothetical protein PK299_08980, partial [Anaerolineales bacterium]|nr:hypothetical protein [Anaerolineales bacterium]
NQVHSDFSQSYQTRLSSYDFSLASLVRNDKTVAWQGSVAFWSKKQKSAICDRAQYINSQSHPPHLRLMDIRFCCARLWVLSNQAEQLQKSQLK